MKDLFKKQRPTSVLALAFDGNQIEGLVIKRTNGSAQVTASFNATLSLDLLTNEAELVGREIRNHLEAAEIRERRCVVCLPLNWVLALQTKLPELPESDMPSFLELEAERGFPYSPDALMISASIARLPGLENLATQIAVPRDHVVRLEKVLRAARLTPLSFSLGLSALQPVDGQLEATRLAVMVGDNTVGLQVTAGGGLVTLRALDGSLDTEGSEKRVHADGVARELRITFGQLPASVRDRAQSLQVFGSNAMADRFAQEIQPRLASMGLTVRRVTRLETGDLGVEVPADAGASAALALGARYLAGRTSGMEFLPPVVSAWQQLTARYSSKKLAYAGVVAGGLALLVLAAFSVQQVQLMRLRSQWAAMSSKVRELEDMQQRIRQFRPWFDESYRSLSILQWLTEAFPEDGAVTAKTIEFRESAPINCAGTARDNGALMKVIDRLRNASEVADVQVDQLRGKSPTQFTFNFQWGQRSQP